MSDTFLFWEELYIFRCKKLVSGSVFFYFLYIHRSAIVIPPPLRVRKWQQFAAEKQRVSHWPQYPDFKLVALHQPFKNPRYLVLYTNNPEGGDLNMSYRGDSLQGTDRFC